MQLRKIIILSILLVLTLLGSLSAYALINHLPSRFFLSTIAAACVMFVVSVMVILAGLTFALRWFNPPITAFMLANKYACRKRGQLCHIQYAWVDAKDISKNLYLAAIVSEDPIFFDHIGFNFKKIMNSLLSIGRHGKPIRGTSTISQQVAKNIFLFKKRSIVRKLIEAYITLLMELFWSKERILEVYLNIAQFDDTLYGVGAAARQFWNMSAKDIDPPHAALLIAALPNPTYLKVKAPSADLVARQKVILAGMASEEGITRVK